MKELTQEQQKKLVGLKARFICISLFTTISHVFWIFVSNLFLTLLNEAYFHNQMVFSLSSLAFTLVILMGLQKNLTDSYSVYTKSVNEAKNSQ